MAVRPIHRERHKFPEVQRFWQESKQTEIQTIERLKELIREHVRKDNF